MRTRILRLTGITARTTLLAWTVTLATLGIFVAFIVPEQKHDLQQGLASKAQGVAAALQGEVAGAAISEDYSSVVDHAMQVLSGDQAVDFLVIAKNDGYALVVERDSWRVVAPIDDYWRPADRQSHGEIEIAPLFNRRCYHYAVPFDYSGLQWGWVHVGLSLTAYDNSVSEIYRRTGLLAVLCILLSLAASLVYARRFVDPILRLRSTVEQVAGGDLMARAHVDSNDEIEQLADAFNNMTDAILHRNRIVEGVRVAAQVLQGASEWNQVIEQILEKLGYSTDASRVVVCERQIDAAGAELWSVRFEWDAAEIMPARPHCQQISLAENGVDELDRRMTAGEMVILRVEQQNPTMVAMTQPPPLSTVMAPIQAGDLLWGALVLHDCANDREWHEVEQDSVRAVAEMLGASIVRQNARMALFEAKNQLENRVIERTRELQEQIVAKDKAHAELEDAQKRLIELSRLSGMAEVATSVLHNVGNVLNSINVSSTLVGDRLRASRVSQLNDLAQLLKTNRNRIGDFLEHDPSGLRVLPYLEKLSTHLLNERDELSAEMDGMVLHVAHVKDIVSMQQTYARTSGVLEKVALHTLIYDSLRITQEEMDRHHVRIQKDIDEVPPMTTDRNKVLQILLNLLRNAKDAVVAGPATPREIVLKLRSLESDAVRLTISDNGIGIAPENLTRVFSHGFTTKKDGHGFGLHFGALTANQLGGSLIAESDGNGRGATFTLDLHFDKKTASEPRRPS